MKQFIRWLVDGGHRVRLFWGDDVDQPMVDEILADLAVTRPDLERGSVVADPFSSLRELMQKMELVGTVVGTRFHSVLSGLKLGKPTISIGYAVKFDALMSDMGMLEFSQSALSVDVDRLITQFTELERRSAALRSTLSDRSADQARAVDQQFEVLSSLLFDKVAPTPSPDRAYPVPPRGSERIGQTGNPPPTIVFIKAGSGSRETGPPGRLTTVPANQPS